MLTASSPVCPIQPPCGRLNRPIQRNGKPNACTCLLYTSSKDGGPYRFLRSFLASRSSANGLQCPLSPYPDESVAGRRAQMCIRDSLHRSIGGSISQGCAAIYLMALGYTQLCQESAGGDDGSRTRVRKHFPETFSERSLCFKISPLSTPKSRL